ncbi:hypothetical protein FSP39_015868 [Pinctada imbricata]|uniref:FAM69 protein-kinase domain-containing protein n=1 Tax=Pinctada imbricata TaxID=66713 RepID=A0AA88XRM6_PINIB|nr:hypothetical protein FSP39_015868 [Pinctada imbricata]
MIFDSENFSHQDTTVATLLSGWRLVEQNEYLFTKSHQHVSYYPKIYGTCGSFYLTEYVPPDLSYFPNFLITKEVSWNMRVTVAMEILNITESMDKNFHEPLHFCDVKVWNYGISPVGEVKVIDTDSMYYESDLTDTMGKLNCTSHEHCDFNDCHGFCVLTTGKCRPQRTNNNLQKICQDILSDDPKNFFAGLVHNPPTDLSYRITTLVQECANPDGSHGILSKARSPTPAVYYHKLRHILQKSLVLYKTTQNAHNKYV